MSDTQAAPQQNEPATNRQQRTAAERWNAAHESEAFRSLSYPDQMEARSRMLNILIEERDPIFANMDREELSYAYDRLMSRPPAFENPEMADFARTVEEEWDWADVAIHGAWHGISSSGALGAIIGRTFGEAGSQLFAGQSADDILMGSDADKLRDYIILQHEHGSSAALANTAFNISTTMMEMFAASRVLGSGLEAVGGRATAGLASAARTQRRASFFRNLGPVVAREVGESAYYVASQEIGRALQGHESEYLSGTGMDWGNLARTFGQDFVVGLGASTLISTVGGWLGKSARRMATGRGAEGSLAASIARQMNVSTDEAANVIRMQALGNITDTQLREMPEVAADQIRSIQRVGAISAGNLDNLRTRPLDATYLEAAHISGMAFFTDKVDEAGRQTFRLYSKGAEDGWRVRDLTTIGELRENLGREAIRYQAEFLENSKHADVQAWRTAHERLLNWGTRSMEVDGVYEASAKVTNIEAGGEVSQADDFVSLLTRPYISPAEARHLEDSIAHVDGQMLRFDPPDIDNIVANLNRGMRLFDGAETLRVAPSATGSVAIPALRVADTAAAEQIEGLVQKAVRSGSTLDPTELRKFYALDTGYDAIRHADDTVELLLPHKARVISNMVDDQTGELFSSAAKAATKTADSAETVVRNSDVATEATIRQDVTATLGLREAAQDDRLIAEISAQRLKGTVQQQDVRTLARMYLQRYNIPVQNVSVKLSKTANSLGDGSDRVARALMRNGGVEIQLPKAITSLDAQSRVVKELFDDFATVVKGQSETAAEAAARNFRRGADQISDPAIRRQTTEQADRMVARERARGSGRNRPHRGTYYRKLSEESTRRFEMPVDGTVQQRVWMEDVARRMGGSLSLEKSGKVLVNLPGQNPARFDTFADAYDAMMIHNVDLGYLRYDLGRQGYKLTELARGKGFRVEGPGLAEPFNAQTAREVMDKLNYRPERIDMAFGPRVLEVQDSSVTLQLMSNRVAGNHQQLMKYLSNFEDTQKLARSTRFRSLKHAEIRRVPGGHLEVEIPDTGSYLQFANANEALDFTRTRWDTWEGYRFLAENKGFELSYAQGSWILSDGHSVIRASSTAELKKALRSVPDPRSAPDIFEAIDPELSREINQIIRNGDAPSLVTSGMRSTATVHYDTPRVTNLDGQFQTIPDVWRSQLASTRKFFEGLNDRFPEITGIYRSMESGSKMATTEHSRVLRMVDNIFRDSSGRLADIDTRRAVLAFREAGDSAEDIAQVTKIFGERTPEIERMVRLTGELFGTYDEATGAVTGLFGKFGIPGDRFLSNYMPRLRLWALSVGPEVKNSAVNGADILESARVSGNIDSRAAAQLKPFFEHLRSSEALNFMRETDPYELFRTYSSLGHRKLYIGESWSEMTRYLRANNDNIPAATVHRIEQYRNLIAGQHSPIGAEWIADMGENVMRRLGAKDPAMIKMGRQVFERVQMMQHATNLVWRPYLAIRNSFQPFTTLAPKFGNARIMRAMKDVGDAGEEWYDQARRAGVINDSPPLANQLHDVQSRLSGFVNRGMGMFTRSDQWTRAVAFRVGESIFDDAMARLGTGRIKNAQEFIDFIELRKFAPDLQQRIGDFIRNGDYETARHAFSVDAVTNSMFDYSRAGQPGFHQGSVFGQLFGQYGTYSAGYRDMIADGLRYGTYSDKAAFITTFVGNQLALLGAFTAVGINGSSFTPFGPALFGGGPNFDLSMNALQSFGSGYQGEQARYELARALSPLMLTADGARLNIPRSIPIARQAAWIQQGLEYLDQGDTYNAWLSFTMTPPARE